MKKSLFLLAVSCGFLVSNLFGASAFSPEFQKMLDEAKRGNEISAKELKAMLDKDMPIVMFDAREADQRAEGEILSSVSGENIASTRGNIEFDIPKKLKDKNIAIVTYCRSGPRAIMAADTLRKLGYKNAKSLQGGFKAWIEEGYPVETGSGTMILKK